MLDWIMDNTNSSVVVTEQLYRSLIFYFKLLDFLPETYNIWKRIFYPQLILHSTPKVLQPNFPIYLRRSSTYFIWEIKIPCLEYETSIPMKYFNFLNSFISNYVVNFSFKVRFSISSSPYNSPYSLATPFVLP
ncbi:hypothetical protein CR513_31921, partial [Mucuna pruriens]